MNRPASSSLEPLEVRIAPAVIYAVDTDNQLLAFDSATPGTLLPGYPVAMTGFAGDEPGTAAGTETIRGIDFRPATGELYALGINDTDNSGGAPDAARIYKLDPVSGALSQVGAAPFKTDFPDNADCGFEIDPKADQIRVVNDLDSNLRVNPDTGALIATSTVITPDSQLVGLAYDRNFDKTPKTTLYAIDNLTDSLVRIGGVDGSPSPNNGAVTVVGALGVPFAAYKVGFDIESRTGTAYAVLRATSTAHTTLYTIDLGTGAATAVGELPGNPNLHGMAVALPDDLTIVNPTTATYLDQDGDKVTVKITGAKAGAALSKDDFRFGTGQFGSQLKLLDLSDDGSAHGQDWAKANISITAVPLKTGNVTRGDSFANVGYIKATHVDLGKVIVNGDLSEIDAGDFTTTTPGLASLTAASVGIFTDLTTLPGTGTDLVWAISGKLGSLTVKGLFTGRVIDVTGNKDDDGAIGPVFIGGDLSSFGLPSGLHATGAIGNVTIAGSIFGGPSPKSGSIIGDSSMGKVTVGGSIFGSSGTLSGSILSGGAMGNLSVGGSIVGGSGTTSGYISGGPMAAVNIGGSIIGGAAQGSGGVESGTTMGAVNIKGSLIGGAAAYTGSVDSSGQMGNVTIGGSLSGGTVVDPSLDKSSGSVVSFGSTDARMGNVKVGGSLTGSNGPTSGSIFSGGQLGTVTIGGSVRGGSGLESGSIDSRGNMGAVKIGGDLFGGTANYAGTVYSSGNGNIAGVTVAGLLVGASSNKLTGILSDGALGPVKLGGMLSLQPGGTRISAEGILNPTSASAASAIKSITVLGNVLGGLILGGYDILGNPTNPDAAIGPVMVNGNWATTSLVAGADRGNDGGFGTDDDVKIAEAQPDQIFSKIASVTIKGYAASSFEPGFVNGIVAEQIGTVKVGVRSYQLAPGTDTVGVQLGTAFTFRVREV